MKYVFSVMDDCDGVEDWFDVVVKANEYILYRNGKPFGVGYPINDDPENWINYAHRRNYAEPVSQESEQEKQLRQVIKLTQQDIEHKQRMIDNYEAQRKALEQKRLEGK